jgi:polyisoprenoid-binding protein YceI
LFAFTPLSEKRIKVNANNSSSISYDMSHPFHDWTGKSNTLNSAIICLPNKDSISQVAVSVKISSFDSENSNRDSHVIEVTEALKFPTVSFISSEIQYNTKNSLNIKGKLTFHGISKNISFIATKNTKDNLSNITGEFNLKMSDFGINPPTLMGVSTQDEFKIKFNMFF